MPAIVRRVVERSDRRKADPPYHERAKQSGEDHSNQALRAGAGRYPGKRSRRDGLDLHELLHAFSAAI